MQDGVRDEDGVSTTAWPQGWHEPRGQLDPPPPGALFFLEGGDGPEAQEYGRLRGERKATVF